MNPTMCPTMCPDPMAAARNLLYHPSGRPRRATVVPMIGSRFAHVCMADGSVRLDGGVPEVFDRADAYSFVAAVNACHDAQRTDLPRVAAALAAERGR